MNEDKEEEQKPADSGEGDKPKTNQLIDDTNLAAKRLEDATKASQEERAIAEESYSKMRLAGRAEAGIPTPEKKVLTDTEYAEALERGEVNPLKEDGIIK